MFDFINQLFGLIVRHEILFFLAVGALAQKLTMALFRWLAGYPDEDVRVFVLEGHSKEGGLPAGVSTTEVRSKDPARDASVARVDTKFTHTSYNEFRDCGGELA